MVENGRHQPSPPGFRTADVSLSPQRVVRAEEDALWEGGRWWLVGGWKVDRSGFRRAEAGTERLAERLGDGLAAAI
jgi:hypothetical protein